MILIEQALEAAEAEGRPIRVALVGAGFMGRGIVNQIINSTTGMRLSAVVNRTVENGVRAYVDAGVDDVVSSSDSAGVQTALESGRPVATDDFATVCASDHIDVVVEATGAIEFGCRVVEAAIAGGKHVVLMNAEVDGTVGWALAQQARSAGVVYTGADGDQPGVEMNLYRFVQGMGVEPVLCGNIKGLQDPYRNPTTQQSFAERWQQNPAMVTSFADGSKMKNAFTYEWRFWTIPEVREMLEEAGFSNSYVYFDLEDDDGEDTGEWYRTEEYPSHESWIAYIVAVR